jgi:formate dehydrogenase assembly factor FdhD
MKDVEYSRIDLEKGLQKRLGKVVLDGVVEIKVNEMKPFKMTLVPRNKVDAAIGRLYFMGLINSIGDVQEIKEKGSLLEFKITVRKRELTRIKSDIRVKADILLQAMKRLFESTDVWELTGGVHSAGLFDPEGNILIHADDIGKGNAIDTVIGKGLKERLDFSVCILASTGRQIGFMIEKAVRAKIPIVVSRGAPLYSSIETAEKYGVTLVCFAKGKRMNLYTHGSRVL